MADTTPLTEAQVRHLREIGEAWKIYGPALREWAGLDGGMQWKKVQGAEYLARYWQDDGRKRFTSLGKRSREGPAAGACSSRKCSENRSAAKASVQAHLTAPGISGKDETLFQRAPARVWTMDGAAMRCTEAVGTV